MSMPQSQPNDMALAPSDAEMPQGNDNLGNNDNMQMDGNGEDSTPKKEIQKLTGSLSQELRTYNDGQQQPDTELNKYVAGMILKQAGKSMTQKDKDDVVKKMDSNESEPSNDMPMECVRRIAKNAVNEIFNDSLIDGERKRENKKMTQTKNVKNPYKHCNF